MPKSDSTTVDRRRTERSTPAADTFAIMDTYRAEHRRVTDLNAALLAALQAIHARMLTDPRARAIFSVQEYVDAGAAILRAEGGGQ